MLLSRKMMEMMMVDGAKMPWKIPFLFILSRTTVAPIDSVLIRAMASSVGRTVQSQTTPCGKPTVATLTLLLLGEPFGSGWPVGHDEVADDTDCGGDDALDEEDQPPGAD
jgi:hypothetical protein